jgi:hypothetical protein
VAEPRGVVPAEEGERARAVGHPPERQPVAEEAEEARQRLRRVDAIDSG